MRFVQAAVSSGPFYYGPVILWVWISFTSLDDNNGFFPVMVIVSKPVQNIEIFINFKFVYVYGGFICRYVSVPHVYLVHSEVRRGCHIPWN